MKVPKKETPTEEVKATNLFGREHTPIEEYEWIEECPVEGELEELHEDVLGLAEDVLDHEDVLHMLGEKIQAVEDNQLQDIENLSETVKILECMQKANRMMLDVIMKQDETIKEFKSKHNSLAGLMCIMLIWMAVLTVLFGIYVF